MAAPKELLKTLAPEEQVQLILKTVHGFYQQRLKAGHRLRLAMYLPDPGKTHLNLVYSWDGNHEKCVKDHPDYMQLSSPKGAMSAIAQLYHDPRELIRTIPDCRKDSSFEFFRPDQRNYLKSMMLFKHAFDQPASKDSGFVLCLDTDQPDFFKAEDEVQTSEFLIEMVRLVEYELAVLDRIQT